MIKKESKYPIFGKRLKMLREGEKERRGKKLSQKELASILCVSEPTYRAWEHGEQMPDTVSVINLAAYYGKSCDFILGVSDYDNIGNSDIEQITGLSNESIEALKYLCGIGINRLPIESVLQYYRNKNVPGFGDIKSANRKSIDFINRVLKSIWQKASYDSDGETKLIPNLFATMEDYVYSNNICGTIGGETGKIISFSDDSRSGFIEISTVESLYREALKSTVYNYMEHYRKEVETENAKEKQEGKR